MKAINSTLRSTLARIEDCIDTIRAVRVLNHLASWPKGHSEAPHPRPAYVRDFEAEHGPAPASAEIVLASVSNPNAWD